MRFPTRNPNQDMNEQMARNATPLPPSAFVDNAPTGPMGTAYIEREMERRRQEQRAAQAQQGSPTIGAGVVAAMDVLLHAVEVQRAGGELDLPTVHLAVANLAGLLGEAERRGLGIPVGVTFSGPPAA